MRPDTLENWLAWMEQCHPREIELGLERVGAVLRNMHLPDYPLHTVSVAGTNGKGSSIALLEAMLLAAGYRVGSYTSPHLLRYNERVRIDGEEASDEALCAAFAAVDDARGDISLTYFEFGTLAALWLFAREQPQVLLLEVGLGGRLDAVNIVEADVALVTGIAEDHQQWLGADREAIGYEKAGIFRAARPAVCGDPHPPARLQEHAAALGTPLYIPGRDFDFQKSARHWSRWCKETRLDELPLPALPGEAQYRNAAAVLMVVQLLPGVSVDEAAVRRGLRAARLPGRLQTLDRNVPVLLDVAHNPQAAGVLADYLRAHPVEGRTIALFGIMADKDIAAVLDTMRQVVDAWHVTDLPLARAASARQLEKLLHETNMGVKVTCHTSVAGALGALAGQVHAGDRVVVFGSFHTVAEAMQQCL
jgi:dihydrofolate synthase/folylpolyglutamate synthase